MSQQHKIDYIELATRDMSATKTFFQEVFGWTFHDHGADYTAFEESSAGVNGGFFHEQQVASTANGSALVVLYSEDLDQARETIRSAGGEIIQDVFDFPGGRRFHFREPGGNEMAVWSE